MQARYAIWQAKHVGLPCATNSRQFGRASAPMQKGARTPLTPPQRSGACDEKRTPPEGASLGGAHYLLRMEYVNISKMVGGRQGSAELIN